MPSKKPVKKQPALKKTKAPPKTKKQPLKKPTPKKALKLKPSTIKKKPVTKQKQPEQKPTAKTKPTQQPIKKPIPKKKEEKLSPQEQKAFALTESKLKKLIHVTDLEEFFYLINMLKDKDIKRFIDHYKENKEESEQNKIAKMVHQVETKQQLVELLRDEMVTKLKDEYDTLKENISELRKKGVDLYIEDVRAMAIPLKIKLYHATMEKPDFYAVKKRIESVQSVVSQKKQDFDLVQQKKAEAKKQKQLAKKKLLKKPLAALKKKPKEKAKTTSSCPSPKLI